MRATGLGFRCDFKNAVQTSDQQFVRNAIISRHLRSLCAAERIPCARVCVCVWPPRRPFPSTSDTPRVQKGPFSSDGDDDKLLPGLTALYVLPGKPLFPLIPVSCFLNSCHASQHKTIDRRKARAPSPKPERETRASSAPGPRWWRNLHRLKSFLN